MEQDFALALQSLIPKVGLQAMLWGHSSLRLGVSSQHRGDKINFENPLMHAYRTVFCAYNSASNSRVAASIRSGAKRNRSRVGVQL